MNTLLQYGFTDRIAGFFSVRFPSDAPSAVVSPARVARADRGRVLLATQWGTLHVATSDALVTGDRGAVTADDCPSIAGCLPRSALLQRRRAHEPLPESQVLGANIDLVGVVVPLDRRLSTNRLERTRVAAWDAGAVPLVILTKADLSSRFDAVVAETAERAGVRGVHDLRRPGGWPG